MNTLITSLVWPLLGVAGVSVATTSLAPSQDDPAPAVQAEIHPAMRAVALASQESMLFEGSIESIKPKKKEGADIGDAFVFDITGDMMGQDGKPGFEGEIYVHRSDTGELLIVSKDRAPGFTIYKDGTVFLTRTLTLDGKVMNLRQLSGDLCTLTDFDKLIAGFKKVEFTAPKGTSADVLTFVGELPKKMMRQESSGFDMMALKVLRTDSTVRLDPESKALKGLTFDVVRNDPFSGFGGIAFGAPAELGGEVIIEIGEVPVEDGDGPVDGPEDGPEDGPDDGPDDGPEFIPPGDGFNVFNPDDFDDKVEGTTTRLTMNRIQPEALPKRVAKALEQMREIADEVDNR